MSSGAGKKSLAIGKATTSKYDVSGSKRNSQNEKSEKTITKTTHSESNGPRRKPLNSFYIRKCRRESMTAFVESGGKVGKPPSFGSRYEVPELMSLGLDRKDAVYYMALSMNLNAVDQSSFDLTSIAHDNNLSSADLEEINQYYANGFNPVKKHLLCQLWPEERPPPPKTSIVIEEVESTPELLVHNVEMDGVIYDTTDCGCPYRQRSPSAKCISVNGVSFPIRNGLVVDLTDDDSIEWFTIFMRASNLWFDFGAANYVERTALPTNGPSFPVTLDEPKATECLETISPVTEVTVTPEYDTLYVGTILQGPNLHVASPEKLCDVPLFVIMIYFIINLNLEFLRTLAFERNRQWDVSNIPDLVTTNQNFVIKC